MKYLKKFDQHSEYEGYLESENYLKPNVSYCGEHNNIHHSEKDLTKKYLTFTALEDGEFTLTINSSVTASDLSYIEYSIDDGATWVHTDNSSSTVTITTPTVEIGGTVLWRGSGTRMTHSSYSYCSIFSSTGRCNVSGNINTLLKEKHPNDLMTLPQYAYISLFSGMTTLVDASELILPATKLGYYCYGYMFRGCSSLTGAPKLPAMDIASYCYSSMFSNCISLTTAPELPATKMYSDCYSYMFYGCSSLTTAPTLPAKRLVSDCYKSMFADCTSLNYIKVYAISDENGFSSNILNVGMNGWVQGVGSTGTFIKHPSATWELTGWNGVPTGWTVQYDTNVVTEYSPQNTFTPTAYVTIEHSNLIYFSLVRKCQYHTVYMSKNGTSWHEMSESDCIELGGNDNCYVCGSLTQAPANGIDVTQFGIGRNNFSIRGNCNSIWNYSNLSASTYSYCGYYMFSDCRTLISASGLTLPSLDLSGASSCYSYMFAYCLELEDAPELPATTLSSYCYASMFRYCENLETAQTVLPALVLTSGCYYYMFFHCQSLLSAPSISATSMTGTSNCAYMFNVCTSLVTPPPYLSSTTITDYCYQYMFSSCSSLTTAPTISATNAPQYCSQYMFYGCSSLVNNIPSVLPATTLANYCYQYMFCGCSSITTAPALPAIELKSNCYSSMFKNCTSLNYVKALFKTDISSTTSYTSNWLNGVSATGTFVKHPLATWERTDVTGIPSGWTVEYDDNYVTEYNPTETFTPAGYLTFTFSSSSYLGFKAKSTYGNYNPIYMSKNGANWQEMQDTDIFEFNSNESCYICGSRGWPVSNPDCYTNFAVNGNFSVSGNCNAFWNYSDLNAPLQYDACGANLFKNCTGLIDASGLILPATTLTSKCYLSMFEGCTSLISAPELPATTLATECYHYMFRGCTSLTTAPSELPATTLATECYDNMFNNCTSLEAVPELPAETLVTYCYYYMFRSCIKINYIKALFISISGTNPLYYWVNGVATTGIFVKHIDATWTTTGSNGVPTNWTIIYFDTATEKYYLSDKTTECDDHGNVI